MELGWYVFYLIAGLFFGACIGNYVGTHAVGEQFHNLSAHFRLRGR